MNVAIDISAKLFLLRPERAHSPSQLIKSVKNALCHPEFQAGMSIVLDVRALGLEAWTKSDICALSIAESQIPWTPTGAKVAVVEDTDFGFGLLRMWQARSNRDVQAKRGVFRTLDEARLWLRSGQTAT